MRRDHLEERVDEAIEEMRSGQDELERHRDDLERRTERAREAARRGREATASTDADDDEADDAGPTTAEEGDAVDEAPPEER